MVSRVSDKHHKVTFSTHVQPSVHSFVDTGTCIISVAIQCHVLLVLVCCCVVSRWFQGRIAVGFSPFGGKPFIVVPSRQRQMVWYKEV